MRAAAVLLAIVIMNPQSPASSFEVATIKPNKSSTGRSMSVTPGRINYVRVTLKESLAAAYGLQYDQVLGPDWLQSSAYRYDIVAKADGNPSNAELMQMLQALLSDRFKLKLHHEKREMSGYALLIGKNGPKLKASESDREDSSQLVGGSFAFHTTMATFAGFLTGRVGRPVFDNTHLGGKFDFSYVVSNNTGDRGIEEVKVAESQSKIDPSIWIDALEPLGLKLEAQKSLVDFLVIDEAVNTPTEN